MTLDGDLIESHIKSLEKECDDIEDQMYEIVMEVGGGVTLTDVRNMSSSEKNSLVQMINKKARERSGVEYL